MDSIGQQLKAARERKGVTASQAAAATHLKVQHVEALEHDDYSRLTVPTYAKGFLRLYAEYLGLDPAPLLREYTARFVGQSAAAAPAEKPATPTDGSVFKSPRRPLPAAPLKISLPPELLTRLLQAAVGVIVLLLLIWVVRHGCTRAPKPAVEVAPPPMVTNQPRATPPPTLVPAKHEQPTPWIIVNEPPPPYLKRSNPTSP